MSMPVQTADENQDELDQPVTLLLSGGGFRATLFHLGVLRYLSESGRLAEVKRVFSVSGGSILAAFLAANWDAFSNPTTFPQAAREVINYTQSDARGRLLRRLLAGWITVAALLVGSVTVYFAGLFDLAVTLAVAIALVLVAGLAIYKNPRRTEFLSRDLATHLRKIQQDDARRTDLLLSDLPKDPEFHFLTTDLTTGMPWAFTRQGVWRGDEPDKPIVQETYPLAKAVAASAAFPPLFPPLRFPKKVDADLLRHDHFLADGGVHDNLGIEVARSGAWQVDHEPRYLISNAERRFDQHEEATLWLLPRRAARATDILMNRASQLHSELVKGDHIRLADELTREEVAGHFPVATQRLVRNVRTDLNRFSDEECQLLFFCGYLSAWEALDDSEPPVDQFKLSQHGMPLDTKDDRRWLPFDKGLDENPENALGDSAETPLGLLSRSDGWGVTWLALALLFFTGIALLPLEVAFARWLTAKPPQPITTVPGGVWQPLSGRLLNDPLENLPADIPKIVLEYVAANRRERDGSAAFVSRALAESGAAYSGSYDLLVDPKNGNHRIDNGTRFFLIYPDGKVQMLKHRPHTDGRVVEVPTDQPTAHLCLTVLLYDTTAEVDQPGPNPLPNDETILLRVLQPHEIE